LGECVVLDDDNASDEADAGEDSFTDIFLDFDWSLSLAVKSAAALAWRKRWAYDTVGPERVPDFVVHGDVVMASLTSLYHERQQGSIYAPFWI